MWFLRNLWLFILDFIETIVVSLAIFALVYMFLFQPHQVDGQSMEPTFHNNEYILTDKLSYRLHAPKRGDVVVFHSPQDQRVDFIKRIVGVPGDTLMIQGGHVYLNGEKLAETYINDPGKVLPGKFMKEGQSLKVPSDNYLVMGDNRLHSSDSREWGLVTKQGIVGRAFFRYWPVPAFGVLPTAEKELTAGAVQGAMSEN
ncbi:MAG: Signal peptidase I [Microgenomates group bacterium GW2011_GWF2_47_9]|nr:MAG: Signal peptidase I [Microgenomates group bacterium GW2011_GWF2_47_9]